MKIKFLNGLEAHDEALRQTRNILSAVEQKYNFIFLRYRYTSGKCIVHMHKISLKGFQTSRYKVNLNHTEKER